MERTSAEISEIERHKYFLSEKRGYDVGWEVAEQDWEASFGDEFRSQCATQVEICDGQRQESGFVAVEARDEGCAATRVDSEQDSGSCPSVIPAPRWRRFLSKLWSK